MLTTGPAPLAERVELARPQWVRSGAPGEVSLTFAALGAASFAVARFVSLESPWLQLFACPFRAATGLPCLGCGATHAFVHLAHDALLAAVAANPLWALVAAILWLHAAATLVRLAGVRWTLALPAFSPHAQRRARWMAAGLIAANWCFVCLHR